MLRRGALILVAAAALGAAFLWNRRSSQTPPPLDPVAVEWAGCSSLLDGLICELTKTSTLTIWVPPVPAAARCGPLAASLDAQPLKPTILPLQRGHQLKIAPRGQAGTLKLKLCDQVIWSLSVRPRQMPELLDKLQKLRRKAPQKALEELAASPPNLAPRFEGVALGLQARIVAPQQGIAAAKPIFEAAIAKLEAAGRLSDACDARAALSHYLREALRLKEAEATLAGGPRCMSENPQSRAYWPYYQATVALETLDIRRALGLLDLALPRLERLGLSYVLQLTLQQKGRLLAILGRFGEAQPILERAHQKNAPCFQAYATNELGWTALQAYRVNAPIKPLPEVIELLERGLKEAKACGPGSELVNILLSNMTFALLESQAPARAAQTLAQAQKNHRPDSARAQPWWLEAKGHIHRLNGALDEAAKTFDKLAKLGAQRVDAQIQLKAALGLGMVFEQQGHTKRALMAYESADGHFTRLLSRAPFGEGRASFIDARSQSTTRRLGLYLREGRIPEAAQLARSSLRLGIQNLARATQLSSMDAKQQAQWASLVGRYQQKRQVLSGPQRWRLPQVELEEAAEQAAALEAQLVQMLDQPNRGPRSHKAPLPKPQADELLLVFHPLDGARWALFAMSSTKARAIELSSLNPKTTPQALSDALLKPLVAMISAAKAVRVLAPGALGWLDLHALPFQGRPLLASKTVLYTLDQKDKAAVAIPQRGLVAHDLTGGLPAAQREAELVARALQSETFPKAGTLTQLAQALQSASHFHYAGHGATAGPDGLDSALVLSDHLKLTSADVLTLKRVPGTVVLSGCELARTAETRQTLTLGMGQAFILRGAQRVVAPVRPVKDTDAARFSARLYAALATAPTFDDAVVMAQLALTREGDSVDWSAFRVLAP